VLPLAKDGTMLRTLLLAAPLLPLLMAAPAVAQMDSREGIALQNQILQLRNEVEQLRRSGGGGGGYVPAPVPSGRAGGGGSSELTGQLLDRVNQLDEEVRRLRGRSDEAEFRNRTLQQQVEKLQGDMDYRLQQLENGGGGASRAAPAPAPAPTAAPSAPSAPPAAANTPRTAERALADGQAALSRRDYAAAETAAREVVGSRGARAQDGQLLLADALLGRRDYANAAIAYDDAYKRNRQAARAPEAMVGLANAFIGLNAKREACDTLNNLRSEFPRLSGNLATRATEARGRAGCR
jgi:TolA-binding protein